MMHEEERDRVSRQGTQAWQRLKKDKNYFDWVKVGEAHQVGREGSMNQAGTNRPQGKGYNIVFAEWLAKYKFDDMDKGDRSRLFELMDNLPQVEAWRQTLTLTERLKLNHPNAVLRKWKAHMRPEDRDAHGEPKPTLRDSVVNLSEEITTKDREIAGLKAHIAELEAAPGTDGGHDVLDALHTLLTGTLSRDEVLAAGFSPAAMISLAKELNEIGRAAENQSSVA
jgi:hypothetical protein